MNDDLEFRRSVLFSVYGALKGEIVPSMRRITVRWSKKNILVTVYTHGELSDHDKEDFDGNVITRIIADFPYPDKGDPIVTLRFVRCDEPKVIEDEGDIVYARKEY